MLNKADLLGGVAGVVQGEAIAVSALTGEGLDRLLGAIDARLAERMEVLRWTSP